MSVREKLITRGFDTLVRFTRAATQPNTLCKMLTFLTSVSGNLQVEYSSVNGFLSFLNYKSYKRALRKRVERENN